MIHLVGRYAGIAESRHPVRRPLSVPQRGHAIFLLVHPTKKLYHCFGCGAKGDIFRFVERVEGVTFPRANSICSQTKPAYH